MNLLLSCCCILLCLVLTSCDLRTGIAKDNMDKYTATPTPVLSPTPSDAPIDPSDILAVDTSLQGDTISITSENKNKALACAKFNRVIINVDSALLTVKGPCRQIMINGDNNAVTVDAVMEVVFNGRGNNVGYHRFVNGKRPSVLENQSGNAIEKTSAQAVTGGVTGNKIVR